MIIIRNYRLEEKGGLFYVIAMETSHCPICQGMLYKRGTRRRAVSKNEEDKHILSIRRLYCERCKCIHHELPDCVVPYKRYGTEVIENIVTNDTQTKVHEEPASCSDGTKRRILGWWTAVMHYFLSVLQTLSQKFKVSFSSPPAFKELVRAVTNSNNWIFSSQVCTRSESRPE